MFFLLLLFHSCHLFLNNFLALLKRKINVVLNSIFNMVELLYFVIQQKFEKNEPHSRFLQHWIYINKNAQKFFSFQMNSIIIFYPYEFFQIFVTSLLSLLLLLLLFMDVVSCSGPFRKLISRFYFITKYNTIVQIFSMLLLAS